MIVRAQAGQGQIVSDRLAAEIARYEREKNITLPFRAPNGPAVEASIAQGDHILIDDGAGAQYQSERLIVWIHRGPRVVSGVRQTCIFIQYVFGPSKVWRRIIHRAAQYLVAQGWGNVPAFWPPGLGVADDAEAVIAGDVVIEPDGLRRTTAAKGLARYNAAGVTPL